MPKHSSKSILVRWREMDAALGNDPEGLHVPSFAKRWGISTKTVQRDLASFRQLGQDMDHERSGSAFYWHYKPGVDYLFVANQSRAQRTRPLTEIVQVEEE